MHIVGLTGGIGTGKSVVASLFVQLGIPVYNSDNKAKWLMNNNDSLKDELVEAFGVNTYGDGVLNKTYLSNLVFNDSEKLKKINEIVHPYVRIDFEEWLNHNSSVPYVIKEAAILIESGAYKQVDSILLVLSDLENRIARVLQRDNVKREDVLARIKNQLSDEEKQKFSDYTIDNNSSLLELEIKVKATHKEILKSL
jgi:dephospho-CoA kinase